MFNNHPSGIEVYEHDEMFEIFYLFIIYYTHNVISNTLNEGIGSFFFCWFHVDTRLFWVYCVQIGNSYIPLWNPVYELRMDFIVALIEIHSKCPQANFDDISLIFIRLYSLKIARVGDLKGLNHELR